MAYPFITIDTCGCTPVPSNCNDNCTTKILSSNIIYNGPELTCTTIEPCNTLNVVLQKMDAVICGLLSEIDVLNAAVIDFNSQIAIINTNITEINNRLDVCCP
jgi:hypothetical protein